VQSGGKSAARAVAGQRTAVNLAGIEVGEIHRGMGLASPGRFFSTRRINARLTLLSSARKLKNRGRVHFHQGTAESVADIVLLEGGELQPGQSAFAQLLLAEPVLVLPGDRFILRQFSPVVTIGGGVVLENLASRHRRSDAGVRARLEAVERGDRAEILAALVAAEHDGLDLHRIVARTGWLESEARAAAESLQASGKLQVLSQQPFAVAARAVVAECARRIREDVEKFHRANPLVEGVPKEDLRERVRAGAEVFRAALDELVAAREVALRGDLVKRAGREIELLPEEARAKEQIERQFERSGLTVPSLKEVLAKLPVEAKRAQKLLQILLREGTLVKVSEELVFHRSAMTRLRDLLADYRKQKGERLPIGAFKELTRITRKYAIPLLEYLDRERVTRRVGDERIIL
jgi:selenocysteine-specific elongation factor